MPSMTATGGGKLGTDNSAVIAGAVIGAVVVLLLVVTGIALIVTLLVRRTKLRPSGEYSYLHILNLLYLLCY